jgi:hypothetical protein
MRLFAIVLFLVVVASPVSLFAQSGGSDTSSSNTSGGSISAGFGDTTVANQSEQGGFIGGGRPVAFVGTTDIYLSSSSAARRSSTTSRTTTATRPRTQMATASRTAGATNRSTQLGNTSNQQLVRALTSLDADLMIPIMSPRPMPTTIGASLARLQGIQDSQITFTSSPTGTTAVLTGTVSSDRERKVAEQFLLLEPGIDRVNNKLEIR